MNLANKFVWYSESVNEKISKFDQFCYKYVVKKIYIYHVLAMG